MDYKIIKLINKEKLNNIKNIISKCNWVDGLTTWQGEENRKKNQQVDVSDPNYKSITSVIYSALDADRNFLDFTLADTSSPITISKYTDDCYYNTHFDKLGPRYSTTIFLNDPSEYEGGELCLYINGKEEKFKLPAGHAIIYSTGILHRVNKVTKGERLCAIFWSYSKIKDDTLLNIYRDLVKLRELVKEKITEEDLDYSTFESYQKSPSLFIEAIIEKLHRKLV